MIMFAVGNCLWASIATTCRDSATASPFDRRSFVPVWMIIFWGSLRVDGQRVFRAVSVVGHQNLATLWVGKSFRGSMCRPFESKSRAVFIGCGGVVVLDRVGGIRAEAAGRGGCAGDVSGPHRPGVCGSVVSAVVVTGRSVGVDVHVVRDGSGGVDPVFDVGVPSAVGSSGVRWVGEEEYSPDGDINISRLLSVCAPVVVVCTCVPFSVARVFVRVVICFDRF